ncbi:phage tail protein [Anoxynatronum sibiricum]|uniref:Tail fiber protein n=1 Tax=Anoxynatronum sibiricum TaxID=210623 RepID=A0ABU9VXR0_9CLOT
MKKKISGMIIITILLCSLFTLQTWANEAYLGEIRIFAGNFAPKGWALCNGQLLLINQNQALFALLGTTYGGDGVTTFALPDLRDRVAIGAGDGYNVGDKGGSATVTLIPANLPAHSHTAEVTADVTGTIEYTNNEGNTPLPGGHMLARGDKNERIYSDNATPTDGINIEVTIDPQISTSAVGGGQPVNNMMPSLGLNYIIALQGIFPSFD